MSTPETPTIHQHPPYAIISPTDHTGWVVIYTTVGLPILLIFATIRYVVRRTVDFGLDDGFLAASTAVAIIQACVVLGACSRGFGRTAGEIQSDSLVSLQQLYYGSNILFLIALALSKASVAALLLRLCVDKTQKRYFIGALVFVGLWLIASIFVIALQCDLSRPWILLDGKCDGVLLRWQVIGGLDIAWEILLVAMAVALVWSLQASIFIKVQVVSSFLFRLPLAVAIAFRLHTFPEVRLTVDPSLELAAFVVWTQAELYWSIISATIPSMRPFLRGLNTTETAVFEHSTDPATRSEYELTKIRSGKQFSRFAAKLSSSARHSQHFQTKEAIEMNPMPEQSSGCIPKGRISQLGCHLSPMPKPERGSIDSGSDESQRMIIRKDISWTVERD